MTTMPIARPLFKYDRLKTRITTPGGGLSASRIADPTPITLSVVQYNLLSFGGDDIELDRSMQQIQCSNPMIFLREFNGVA